MLCPTIICLDEKKDGDMFTPTKGSPQETYKCSLLKCVLTPCLKLPLCNLHTCLSQTICGCAMEPPFNGKLPFWFCKEFKLPSIKFVMTTCGERCGVKGAYKVAPSN